MMGEGLVAPPDWSPTSWSALQGLKKWRKRGRSRVRRKGGGPGHVWGEGMERGGGEMRRRWWVDKHRSLLQPSHLSSPPHLPAGTATVSPSSLLLSGLHLFSIISSSCHYHLHHSLITSLHNLITISTSSPLVPVSSSLSSPPHHPLSALFIVNLTNCCLLCPCHVIFSLGSVLPHIPPLPLFPLLPLLHSGLMS